MTHTGRVSPFGNPRIKVCSQLPVAYRSVLRPSSPLSAKASTKCPSTLDPTANPTRRDKPPDHSGRFAPTRHAAIGLLSTSSHSFTTAGQVGTQDPGATPCGATTSDLAPTERPPAAAQPIHNVQQPDGDPRTSLPGTTAAKTRFSHRGSRAHPLTHPQMVELNGIEPMTSCLQSRRSPN